MKASELKFGDQRTQAHDRQVEKVGDDHYRVTFLPAGIVLDLDRVRRERRELWCELTVSVNEDTYPDAHTVNGVVTVGDLNLSSVSARTQRGKLIGERTKTLRLDLDWYGLLEQAVMVVFADQRTGTTPTRLSEVEIPEDGDLLLSVDGWTVPYELPTILYGAAANGKSLLSMYFAGRVASQGVNVLYLDWEFGPQEHARRYRRLYPDPPPNVFYQRCERGLRYELDGIRTTIEREQISYVIVDSIGFAVDGDASSQELAVEYARCLRQMRVGSLSLGHTPRASGESEPDIFGSSFYRNLARSMWRIDKDDVQPDGGLGVTLVQTKNSIGAISSPLGFTFGFEDSRTRVLRTSQTPERPAPVQDEVPF